MLTLRRSRSLLFALAAASLLAQPPRNPPAASGAGLPQAQAVSSSLPERLLGFRDSARQLAWDRRFLADPSAALAREELKTLTVAPHWAGSPEDYGTALFVANHFRAAGLKTEIVPYSVLMSKPTSIVVEAFDASGAKVFSGPTPEEPQPDPHAISPFASGSPSGDVTAPVVYANYGRREDYDQLAQLGVQTRGKIVLVRYGQIFRGTKVYLAQRAGAAAVLLFSDPADTAVPGAPAYPDGRNPPPTAVQRGAVQFLPIYPGDPTTPGVASVPGLPAVDRIPVNKLQYDLPSIPAQPLSAADAAPLLRALHGVQAPRDWQGAAIGTAYHIGSAESPLTVHLHLAFDTGLRTIWDVIGRIQGSDEPEDLVVAGNHRDAWMYGATDPSSGTVAMLEAVRGLGTLLSHGWRPRRTIVVASWDGEEQGLVGSTEWVEQHVAELKNAVAYLNIDEAASGPAFRSSAVPSLREFVREVAAEVQSASGGRSALDQWLAGQPPAGAAVKQNVTEGAAPRAANESTRRTGEGSKAPAGPRFGELGSGSDYSPFLDHAGVPATDIGSDGPFGVYHSAYDNFDWFTRFADPDFALTVQQARVFGLEILHLADADVLPFDETEYAEVILGYLGRTRARATARGLELDFAPALAASDLFLSAARRTRALQGTPAANAALLNPALLAAEHALVVPEGLPTRPWYRHAIYAPGLDSGYAAEPLPGVNDAIDAGDAPRAQQQLTQLAAALGRAAAALQDSER